MPHLSPTAGHQCCRLGPRRMGSRHLGGSRLVSWLSRALLSSAETPPARALEEEGHSGITLCPLPGPQSARPDPRPLPQPPLQADLNQPSRSISTHLCESCRVQKTSIPPASFNPGDSPHLIEDDYGTPGPLPPSLSRKHLTCGSQRLSLQAPKHLLPPRPALHSAFATSPQPHTNQSVLSSEFPQPSHRDSQSRCGV